MLDKDIKFYRENKEKLREQYMGKYIVIRNRKVLGAYDTHAEAYEKSIQHNDVGTFIIEHVKPSAKK